MDENDYMVRIDMIVNEVDATCGHNYELYYKRVCHALHDYISSLGGGVKDCAIAYCRDEYDYIYVGFVADYNNFEE